MALEPRSNLKQYGTSGNYKKETIEKIKVLQSLRPSSRPPKAKKLYFKFTGFDNTLQGHIHNGISCKS